MGLARFGIINGAKVPIEGIVGRVSNESRLDPFSTKALRRLGFLGIAHRIINREDLSLREINALIADAGLPVLMKLLGLSDRSRESLTAAPAVLLPVHYWRNFGVPSSDIAAQACDFLRSIPHKTLQVAFDYVDLNDLIKDGGEAYRQISSCRSGLVLVGPSIDDIIKEAPDELARKDEFFDLVLSTLRISGFKRLRASSRRDYLELTKRHDFVNCLMTPIDQFQDEFKLAEELHRLSEISAESDLIDCWSPGVLNHACLPWSEQPATDFQLLRVLAIGSLTLRRVPIIRASILHFSLDTIHLATHFGANDLGFGAFDQITKESLKLQPINKLTRISRLN